jgi:hypothetical protein
MLNTLGGKVQCVRVRGSKVQALSGFAIAVENQELFHASPSVQNGVHSYVFSEVGAGLFPVAIIGPDFKAVEECFRTSDVYFRIAMSEALADGKSFTIRARKKDDFNLTNKPYILVDPVRDAGKNVANTAIGFMPVNALSVPTVHGGEMSLLGAAKDAGCAISDAKSGMSPKGSQGGLGRHVGVLVYMMGDKNFVDTYLPKVHIQELANLLFGNRCHYIDPEKATMSSL